MIFCYLFNLLKNGSLISKTNFYNRLRSNLKLRIKTTNFMFLIIVILQIKLV